MPFSASEAPRRHDRRAAGIGASFSTGKKNDTALSEIERLISAIAERDPAYRQQGARHPGSIAVALDSITRWIDKAESRFSDLSARNGRIEKLVAELATLMAATRRQDIALIQSRVAEAAATALRAQQTQNLQRTVHQRCITVITEVLDKMVHAIDQLERKIAKLEERASTKPDTLLHQIQGLATHLDAHMRCTADEALSSRQHFDRMTRQIEIFAEELRQVKEKHKVLQPQSESLLSQTTSPGNPGSEADMRIRSSLIAAARHASRSDIRPTQHFLRRPEGDR